MQYNKQTTMLRMPKHHLFLLGGLTLLFLLGVFMDTFHSSPAAIRRRLMVCPGHGFYKCANTALASGLCADCEAAKTSDLAKEIDFVQQSKPRFPTNFDYSTDDEKRSRASNDARGRSSFSRQNSQDSMRALIEKLVGEELKQQPSKQRSQNVQNYWCKLSIMTRRIIAEQQIAMDRIKGKRRSISIQANFSSSTVPEATRGTAITQESILSPASAKYLKGLDKNELNVIRKESSDIKTGVRFLLCKLKQLKDETDVEEQIKTTASALQIALTHVDDDKEKGEIVDLLTEFGQKNSTFWGGLKKTCKFITKIFTCCCLNKDDDAETSEEETAKTDDAKASDPSTANPSVHAESTMQSNGDTDMRNTGNTTHGDISGGGGIMCCLFCCANKGNKYGTRTQRNHGVGDNDESTRVGNVNVRAAVTGQGGATFHDHET